MILVAKVTKFFWTNNKRLCNIQKERFEFIGSQKIFIKKIQKKNFNNVALCVKFFEIMLIYTFSSTI